MNQKQIYELTEWLKYNVFMNEDVMQSEYIWNQEIDCTGQSVDLIDVIASLHNLLYEAITGDKYNYMFHWTNKIGCACRDDIFNELLSQAAKKEEKRDW